MYLVKGRLKEKGAKTAFQTKGEYSVRNLFSEHSGM